MYNKNKMMEIFPGSVLERIKVNDKGNGANVDLHQMGAKEARMFMNALLVFHGKLEHIRVIHGYNHGTVLREMVRETFANYPMVQQMVTPAHNPGETVFHVREDSFAYGGI